MWADYWELNNRIGEVQQAKLTSDRQSLDQLQQSVEVLTEHPGRLVAPDDAGPERQVRPAGPR